MSVPLKDVPGDLLSYLYDLIAPTHLDDCTVPVVGDMSTFDWSEYADQSCHGLIAMSPPDGDPGPWSEQIWRILKPGAHVLLFAPEEEPTGHTGACALEDQGFEVRDAILWVREAGRLHYVPKPSQAERHAGCEHLKLKRREESEDDEDVNDGSWDDKNLHKGNIHPTVKARALMERLLADVPKDAVVLDPFMGSGTTALACLRTGHDFIGIEQEEDYIQIADARVRHHDRGTGDGATIESEAPDHQLKRVIDIFDL